MVDLKLPNPGELKILRCHLMIYMISLQDYIANISSVSYQLTGRKSNPNFWLLKYLIEHTVAL